MAKLDGKNGKKYALMKKKKVWLRLSPVIELFAFE